jgi:hypothetical protein
VKKLVLDIIPRNWILVCLFCLIQFSVLFSQSDSIKRPLIGDHYFTPVTYSNLPFTGTYFSNVLGVGQTTNLVHQLEIINGQQVIGLQGEMTFVEMGFSYQQNVRDWLAAYINLNLSARLGTELQSILSQGINTINAFEIGWHIKFLETEEMAFSANIELENYEGSFINVLGFVKDVINNHPNPQISQTIPVLNVATGLRYAWGINDLIGLKSSIDLAYGETYERGENGFSTAFTAGLDLDFYRRFNIPAGLVLQYTLSDRPEIITIRGSSAQIFRAKLAYTRSSDFSLGLELSFIKLPLPNQDVVPGAVTAAMAARYFF